MPIRFSTETLQDRREWQDIFKVTKAKKLQPRIFHLARLSFRFDGGIKTFPDKQKRIQHHQTSFKSDAKGTSLGRKHKRRKRPTENKPKTIFKNSDRIIHINNYFKCKWIKHINQKT